MNLQPVTIMHYLARIYSEKLEPLLFTIMLLGWTIVLKFDFKGIATLLQLDLLQNNNIIMTIVDIVFIVSITIILTVLYAKIKRIIRKIIMIIKKR